MIPAKGQESTYYILAVIVAVVFSAGVVAGVAWERAAWRKATAPTVYDLTGQPR